MLLDEKKQKKKKDHWWQGKNKKYMGTDKEIIWLWSWKAKLLNLPNKKILGLFMAIYTLPWKSVGLC